MSFYQSISLGVDYIDGDVVGARTLANSPSSVFISSLYVQPPKSKKHMGSNADNSSIATSPPTFEIASGNFVNAAGKRWRTFIKLIIQTDLDLYCLHVIHVKKRKTGRFSQTIWVATRPKHFRSCCICSTSLHNPIFSIIHHILPFTPSLTQIFHYCPYVDYLISH